MHWAAKLHDVLCVFVPYDGHVARWNCRLYTKTVLYCSSDNSGSGTSRWEQNDAWVRARAEEDAGKCHVFLSRYGMVDPCGVLMDISYMASASESHHGRANPTRVYIPTI